MRFWFISALLLLTATFMYLRFPYERLADRIETEVQARSGWEVSIVNLAARPTLLGPGFSAGPVRALRRGRTLSADKAVIRPAWSLSWLKFSPAFHLDVRAGAARVDGVLTLSNPPQFAGQIVEADLEALAGREQQQDVRLTGRADAEIDLALPSEGPQGPVQLTALEGSFSHPMVPLPIPFDRVDAALMFGGDAWLTISSSEIQSPLLSGRAQGTVGTPPGGPIALTLDLAPNPAAAAVLAQQGIRAGRDGRISLQVRGTAANPRLR